MTQRHSWSEPDRISEHKTERLCSKCGLVKVTRHESGEHWTEFYKGWVKHPDDRTPPCAGKGSAVVGEVALGADDPKGSLPSGEKIGADHSAHTSVGSVPIGHRVVGGSPIDLGGDGNRSTKADGHLLGEPIANGEGGSLWLCHGQDDNA